MPQRDLYLPGSPYHNGRQRFVTAGIDCLVQAMMQLGRPASLLDVGCGAGALVTWCRTEGLDAWGVDLAIAPDMPASEGLFHWDLQEPLNCRRLFEWVLCWEVAEHLPETAAETLCDSLVTHLARPMGRLIFTAAPPGQRGKGHIHCRTQEYWRALLVARGLVWLDRASRDLSTSWRRSIPSAPHYGRNVQVFAWA